MSVLTTYCSCYGENYPKWQQHIFNQKNVMCGGSDLSKERKEQLRSQGYMFDDEGVNIGHLNKHFGDLTTTYWVWKNAPEEWVGLTQYRRFWIEPRVMEVMPLNDKTIYIPQPQIWQSVMDQYVQYHGRFGIDKLYEHANKITTKLTNDHVNSLNHIYTMHPYNMLFAHKALYDKVAEVLFEILFDVYEHSKEYIEEVTKTDEYQRRMPAFLAERLLSILYVNRKYYFGNDVETRIVEMVWI